MIGYRLGGYNGNTNNFIFEDGSFLNIDLAKKFPKYRLPFNGKTNNKYHYTVLENNNLLLKNDDKYQINNIITFDKSLIKKISVNPSKFIYYDILFRKTKQCEYDRFQYLQNKNNDNGKLYKYILDIYYNHNNPSNIRTTVIV